MSVGRRRCRGGGRVAPSQSESTGKANVSWKCNGPMTARLRHGCRRGQEARRGAAPIRRAAGVVGRLDLDLVLPSPGRWIFCLRRAVLLLVIDDGRARRGGLLVFLATLRLVGDRHGSWACSEPSRAPCDATQQRRMHQIFCSLSRVASTPPLLPSFPPPHRRARASSDRARSRRCRCRCRKLGCR